ncbi:MAG TPA: hypothetical protein PLB88_04660 [Thermoanaerobaculaceae bacterium]|nr:hypothetical protein [Thermoanaerobaculaceae bacterium]
MSYYPYNTFKANGNILSGGSLVKLDPSNDDYALQAGPLDDVIGVAYPATALPPQNGVSTPYAAIATGPIVVFGPGSFVEVTATNASVPSGFVKPDASGYIQAALPGDKTCGYIFESINANEQVSMFVLQPGTVVPATAAKFLSTAISDTLTVAQNGVIVGVTAADLSITLPAAGAVPAGWKMRVFNFGATATFTAGAVGTQVILANGTDKCYASGKVATAGKGFTNTAATATSGDWVELTSDGSANWMCEYQGTWVVHA